MAVLTEKEITIESSGANIELYAEYRDGKIDTIQALLDIDGYHLGKSPGVLVYENGKFTSFCMALQMALNPELTWEFYLGVNRLINLND